MGGASSNKEKEMASSASMSKLPPPVPIKMDKFDRPGGISPLPPTPPPRGLKRDTSKGCLVAAAVGRRIVRQQLNSSQSKASPALKICSRSRLPPPVPPKSNNVRKLAGPRPRHKSWGQLQVSFFKYFWIKPIRYTNIIHEFWKQHSKTFENARLKRFFLCFYKKK